MTTIPRRTLTLKRAPAEPAHEPNIPEQIPESQPEAPPVLIHSFWFVWAPDGMRPRKRHSSLEAAQAEAERLREAVPGKTFHVYEASLIEEASS